jgi:hypothetical protein
MVGFWKLVPMASGGKKLQAWKTYIGKLRCFVTIAIEKLRPWVNKKKMTVLQQNSWNQINDRNLETTMTSVVGVASNICC